MNTQRSIKTGEPRKDYIMIEPPKKIIKKRIKVNTNGKNKLVQRPRIVIPNTEVQVATGPQLGDQDKALLISDDKREIIQVKKPVIKKVEKKEPPQKKPPPEIPDPPLVP